MLYYATIFYAGQLLLRDGQLGFEAEGMYTWYHVYQCRGPRRSPGRPQQLATFVPPGLRVPGIIRRYYIGAVERYWDYAPVKIDPVDGSSLLHPDQ